MSTARSAGVFSSGTTNRGRSLRGIVSFVNFSAAKNLETLLVRVVHEEEGDTIVVLEVSGADVLLVAAQVGEAEGLVVENAQETLLTAAILDVGPSGLAGRGHVEAVAVADELAFVVSETIAGVVRSLGAFVQVAAAVLFLLLLYERSECEFCEAAAHGISFSICNSIRARRVQIQKGRARRNRPEIVRTGLTTRLRYQRSRKFLQYLRR